MNRYDDYSSAKHFQRVGEQPRKLSLKNKNKWIKESEHHEGAAQSDYSRKADKNYLRTVLPILQSKLHH